MSELQLISAPYFFSFWDLIQTLQRSPQKVLYLEMEPYQHFACTQCGDCCKLPWAIHVSEDYYRRWYDVLDAEPSGRFKEPMLKIKAPPDSHSYASLRRKPGTSECIFLEPDNSCWIHKNHGETALSTVCKTYPRSHKPMGHQYEARYLLNSCEAVPELQSRFSGLFYRLTELAELNPFVSGYMATGYPGRYETYLLLGLLFDLLELPLPDTALGKWQLLPAVLLELHAVGIEQVSLAQMELIYQQTFHGPSLLGFSPPQAADQALALQWSQHFLQAYPGCHQWLLELSQGSCSWPLLSEAERQILDLQILNYLRHRLLTLPYQDSFIGTLGFFQHCFLLTLHVIAVQWLALYYRYRAATSLTSEHVYRAVNVVGRQMEQRRLFKQEMQLDKMAPETCFRSMQVLLSLDFSHAHYPPLGLGLKRL